MEKDVEEALIHISGASIHVNPKKHEGFCFRYPVAAWFYLNILELVRQQGWDFTYNDHSCKSFELFLGRSTSYDFFPKCSPLSQNEPPSIFVCRSGPQGRSWLCRTLCRTALSFVKGWIIITGLHSKPGRWTKLDETAHLYGETGKDSSWVAGLWIWVMKKNRLEDKTQRSWPVSLIRRVVSAHIGSIPPEKQRSRLLHPLRLACFVDF